MQHQLRLNVLSLAVGAFALLLVAPSGRADTLGMTVGNIHSNVFIGGIPQQTLVVDLQSTQPGVPGTADVSFGPSLSAHTGYVINGTIFNYDSHLSLGTGVDMVAVSEADIIFTPTENYNYTLTSNLQVLAGSPGISQGFLQYYDGSPTVNLSTGSQGALFHQDTMLANHTYQFFFAQELYGTLSDPATSDGTFSLAFTPVSAAPATPLPSAATAGITILGGLSLRRSRRKQSI